MGKAEDELIEGEERNERKQKNDRKERKEGKDGKERKDRKERDKLDRADRKGKDKGGKGGDKRNGKRRKTDRNKRKSRREVTKKRILAYMKQVSKRVKTTGVPDWARKAIRVGISMCLFLLLGYGVLFPLGHWEYKREFRESCVWAGITCIVVSVPLLGKVAQVSFERTLGTIIGGIFAFIAYDFIAMNLAKEYRGAFLAVLSAMVAGIAAYLAALLNLDLSAKLFAITFLVVTAAAQSHSGALIVAILRTGGIVAGILVSMVLSIVILPKSASCECIREIRNALQHLAELNLVVWTFKQQAKVIEEKITDKHQEPDTEPDDNGYLALSDIETPLLPLSPSVSKAAALEAAEARCEKIFSRLHKSLDKVERMLALSQDEVYMWHFWGHFMFLPGFRFCHCGGWQVPKREVRRVVACVRRTGRLLWALHRDFPEGIDEEVQGTLSQFFSSDLIPELAKTSQATFKDLIQAYPKKQPIDVDNLKAFDQMVSNLLSSGESQRRGALEHLRSMRRSATASRRVTIPQSSSNEGSGGVSFSADIGVGFLSRSLEGKGGADYVPAASLPRRTFRASSAPASQLWTHLWLARSFMSALRDGAAGEAHDGTHPAGKSAPSAIAFATNRHAAMTATPSAAPPLSQSLDTVELSNDAAHALRLHERAAVAAQGLQPLREDQGARSDRTSLQVQGDTAVRPMAHSSSLSQLMSRARESGALEFGQASGSAVVECSSGIRAASVSALPLGPADTYLSFPPTEEGYVALVHWYSLQFVMDELSDELGELFVTVASLLSRLPYHM